MPLKKLSIDVSNELLFDRFKNGIKLIKPTENQEVSKPRLKDILTLPFSFYLLNQVGETQKINEEGIEVCGFESLSQSLGHDGCLWLFNRAR